MIPSAAVNSLGVRCTHLLSPVLETRSVLLVLALFRSLSRRRRMRCRVGYGSASHWYYILLTSPSVGLRRARGLSSSICFLIQLALASGFSRVSSLAFSWVLYRCLIEDISVCNSWGFRTSLLEVYQHRSVLPRCKIPLFVLWSHLDHGFLI